jgi:hypothetical protein
MAVRGCGRGLAVDHEHLELVERRHGPPPYHIRCMFA